MAPATTPAPRPRRDRPRPARGRGRHRHHPARPAADERAQRRRCRRSCARPPPRPPSARDVSAVVVYGGEKVFAAGADIKEMADHVLHRHGRALRRPAVGVHRGRPDPQAGRRGGHRLRARRRLRARAVRATSGSSATTPSSASPRSCSASSPAPAAPSGWPGWSARPGPRTSSSPAGSSTPTRRCAIGLVDQVVAADEVYAGGARAGRAVRRRPGATRCGPPRRRSTAGSRSTSTPAWRSSGCSSPACSPPRTATIGMALVRRERPGQGAVRGAMSR